MLLMHVRMFLAMTFGLRPYFLWIGFSPCPSIGIEINCLVRHWPLLQKGKGALNSIAYRRHGIDGMSLQSLLEQFNYLGNVRRMNAERHSRGRKSYLKAFREAVYLSLARGNQLPRLLQVILEG